MNKKGQNLSLEDYEQALRDSAANLYMMYKHNGENPTERLVIQLLAVIDDYTTYVENVLVHCPDDKAVLEPMRKALELNKKRNERGIK
jgi:hypothetical protein